MRCDSIFRLAVPAVRIATARRLGREYGMSQAEIARCLGIVQAAVSKYLNGRYSAKMARLVRAIESKGLDAEVAKAAISKGRRGGVATEIDKLASSDYVVRQAMKLL